jgi:hypothetical protein
MKAAPKILVFSVLSPAQGANELISLAEVSILEVSIA